MIVLYHNMHWNVTQRIYCNQKEKSEKQKEEKKEKESTTTEKIEDTLKDKANVKKVDKDKKIESKDEVFEEKKEANKDKDIINEKAKEKKRTEDSPLIENVAPSSDKTVLKRTVSAPPNVTEVTELCTRAVVLHVHAHCTNQRLYLFSMYSKEWNT